MESKINLLATLGRFYICIDFKQIIRKIEFRHETSIVGENIWQRIGTRMAHHFIHHE